MSERSLAGAHPHRCSRFRGPGRRSSHGGRAPRIVRGKRFRRGAPQNVRSAFEEREEGKACQVEEIARIVQRIVAKIVYVDEFCVGEGSMSLEHELRLLGLDQLRSLEEALDAEDHRRALRLLDPISNRDRRRRRRTYMAFHVRGSLPSGGFQILWTDAENPLHRSVLRRSVLPWLALDRRTCGARARSSRGRSVRTRGSRRTSGSARAPDDPGGDPDPAGRVGRAGGENGRVEGLI